MPCPGHPEEGIEHCPGEFEYDNLVKALKRKRNAVECAEEQLPVPLGKLLYGLHVSSAEAMLKDLAEVQRKLLAGQEDLRAGQHELLELAQRQFLSAYNREKDRDFGECPYVFTLSSVSGGKRSGRLMGERLQLHLYCQAPKCWHPVEKGGVYAIEDSADWLKRMAPYMSKLTGMMKTYIPLAATIGSAVLGPQSAIMAEASKLLPDIETETENILNQYRGEGLSQTEGAALRVGCDAGVRQDHDPLDQTPDRTDATRHDRDDDLGHTNAGVAQIEPVHPEAAEKDTEQSGHEAGLG